MQPAKLAGKWAVSRLRRRARARLRRGHRHRGSRRPRHRSSPRRATPFARTGETVRARAEAVVYTGFQWRGRAARRRDADDIVARGDVRRARPARRCRAAGSPAPTTRSASTSSSSGSASEPVVLGPSTAALKTGVDRRAPSRSTARTCRRRLTAGGHQPRSGHQGHAASSVARADAVTLDVGCRRRRAAGPARRLCRRRGEAGGADRLRHVDGIKVLPQAGMARVGGGGVPEAAPAVRGRRVPQRARRQAEHEGRLVTWASSTSVDAGGVHRDLRRRRPQVRRRARPVTGLFTPNVDGPNPKRSGERNNIGDVWVVARAGAERGAGHAKPIRARAHLLVTVPSTCSWLGRRARVMSAPGTGRSN